VNEPSFTAHDVAQWYRAQLQSSPLKNRRWRTAFETVALYQLSSCAQRMASVSGTQRRSPFILVKHLEFAIDATAASMVKSLFVLIVGR